MKAWVLERYGEPEDVLVQRDIDVPSPNDGELLIDVLTAGLSFPDLLRVRSEYQIPLPLGQPPGFEFVGTVRAGGGNTSTAAGTRVFGVSSVDSGALADQLIAEEVFTAPLPDAVDDVVGAALPSNYSTASLALHRRGALQDGESVVVVGGAGGVGSAVTHLAKAAGSPVLAIDAGPARRQLCLEHGADVAVDSTSEDVGAAIQAFTAGKGADVIIDMVGGDLFDECRRAIASEGRIVIVGFTSSRIPEIQVNRLLLRNFAIVGLNAFHYKQEMSALYTNIADLCAAGRFTPTVDGPHPFEDAPRVLTRMANGKLHGKAVVSVNTPGA